ncbi:MAG: cadherin-like beta sandwich domain-containing protein, partial [Verrucomicrobia bacterium]|nr:cadherin-like beta sandwich domain-containing protein [Verrucomicrobiota bacterium]
MSGDTVVVGASMEDSSTTGVNSTPDELASGSGAAYVFTMPPPLSLSGLALSAGTLSPVFASSTLTYAATVANEVGSVTVTATTAQVDATLKVNGTTVASGAASSAINLVVGTNTLSIVLTAQDGVTTNLYTVSVLRYPAPPVATTVAASGITTTGATLNGSVNPGGAADAYFRYGTASNEVATVSTLAGGATSGSTDGTGTNALFYRLRGVAVDGAGNVYVADSQNNRIRKVTAAGVVTTLAGSASGSADGTNAAARFSFPNGVAVDGSGNVYVADSGNNRIRKVTAAGVVTTLAGSDSGFVDGSGAAAQFNYPIGVAVDGSGNVYVGDSGNNRIRKVTAAGVVTTLAGSDSGIADGSGAAAQFNYPSGVAVDSSGNVYVADASNCRIRKVTPAGDVTIVAGSGLLGFADGPGSEAQFSFPMGVAVDATGNVYVGDSGNNRIRKLLPPPFLTLVAQSGLTGTTGTPVSTTLSNLVPETTYYYWAEGGNAAGTNTGTMLSFTTLSTNALLNNIVLSAGTLSPVFASNTTSYATIVSNGVSSLAVTLTAAQINAVLKVNGTTVASGVAGSPINLEMGTNILSIAVTAQDGVTTNLYTVSVWRQPLPPTITTVAAATIRTNGATLNATLNPNGGPSDVWFRYSTDSRLRGIVSTLAGTNASGFVDGTGAAARFNGMFGIETDKDGNVYVAEALNNSIRKVTPAGVVTTFAGASTSGIVDGTGTEARFFFPQGMAMDTNGNLFVADNGNHVIRKITSAGVVTLFAGA